jgi:hypothetical protein
MQFQIGVIAGFIVAARECANDLLVLQAEAAAARRELAAMREEMQRLRTVHRLITNPDGRDWTRPLQ